MAFMDLPDDGRIADYALEVTEEERRAIIAVIRRADGSRRETKVAASAVGLLE